MKKDERIIAYAESSNYTNSIVLSSINNVLNSNILNIINTTTSSSSSTICNNRPSRTLTSLKTMVDEEEGTVDENRNLTSGSSYNQNRTVAKVTTELKVRTR